MRTRRKTGALQRTLPLATHSERTEPMAPEIEDELIAVLTQLLRNAAQAQSARGPRDED